MSVKRVLAVRHRQCGHVIAIMNRPDDPVQRARIRHVRQVLANSGYRLWRIQRMPPGAAAEKLAAGPCDTCQVDPRTAAGVTAQ